MISIILFFLLDEILTLIVEVLIDLPKPLETMLFLLTIVFDDPFAVIFIVSLMSSNDLLVRPANSLKMLDPLRCSKISSKLTSLVFFILLNYLIISFSSFNRNTMNKKFWFFFLSNLIIGELSVWKRKVMMKNGNWSFKTLSGWLNHYSILFRCGEKGNNKGLYP